MRKLVLTPKFKKVFRKFVTRKKKLQKRIEDTLEQMNKDVFAAHLGTHKLGGELSGLYACICGYDCRIVFSIERNGENNSEVIVLLDIDTHDEVY